MWQIIDNSTKNVLSDDIESEEIANVELYYWLMSNPEAILRRK